MTSINISPKSILITLLSTVFIFSAIALGHYVMMVVNEKSLSHQIWLLQTYSVEHEQLTKENKIKSIEFTNNQKQQKKIQTLLLKKSSEIISALPQAENAQIITALKSRTSYRNTDFFQTDVNLLLSDLLQNNWTEAVTFLQTKILPLEKNIDPKTVFIIFCIIIGVLLIYVGKFFKRDGIQSLLGMISGVFISLFMEYMLIYAAQKTGVQRYGGSNPEYILMKYSFPFLVFIMIVFVFSENTRCNFILWLRRYLPFLRVNNVSGKVTNYAMRTSYEYTLITWFFYVILMLAFDPAIFGPRTWFTYVIFFACIASTLYLLYILLGYKSMGANIRYAIPTIIIFWNDIEILSKWGFFEEPWISMNIPIMLMIGIGFIISTFFIIRDIRNFKKLTTKNF